MSPTASASPEPARDRRRSPSRSPLEIVASVLAVVVVFGSPVALLWYFGGERLLSSTPQAGFDFDTHISQVWRVLEGLRGWGRTWVYDVQHLAGYPNGTIFDADNKGWEQFTWALVSLGVPQGLAFNLFVVAAHLLVAPVVYVSARLFGLRHRSSLIAAALAVAYWYFDAWHHWEWFVGMIAYAFASYLFLLPLSAFYRWTRERRPWQAALTAAAMAVIHLVHPYTFFMLVGPMAALYLREARQLTRREHAIVWSIVVLTIVVNAWWLQVAFSFWHYILDSSFFGHTGLSSLVWDLFGLVGDPAAQGVIGNRSGLRMLYGVAAVVGTIAWWRRGDPRTLPVATGLVVFALLAYLGGYTFFSQIQPYRHVGPLGFLTVIPIAGALELAARERWWDRIRRSRPALALVIVLSVPAGQHIARDVLYFTERSLPEPAKLLDGETVWYTMLGYGPHGDFSYGDWQHDDLAAWVRAHDDGTGRFLVENWHIGEQLTWKTHAQVLGGFIWRNLEHSWANFFRRHPEGMASPVAMRDYFRDYGVKWIILSSPAASTPWWDHSPLVQRVAVVGLFRIYRVTIPTSLIEGPGRVEASVNRISVQGTDPARDVLVRYHWLETLACEPQCRIERVPIEGDPVGLMRVPAPHPADFEIRNTYARVSAP